MSFLTRGKLGRRVGAILAAAGIMVILGATPASAGTFSDWYYNPFNGGRYEGSVSFVDCGWVCPDDHSLMVNNVANGYNIRVKFEADFYRNGVYYTYLDTVLSDGYAGKWRVTSTLPQGPVRTVLCYYDSGWNYLGGCQYYYSWHSN